MGKLKAKNRSSSGPHSGGKSSKKSTKVQQRPGPSIPALDKLTDVSFSERQWACHSLLHLMQERENRERLMKGGLVERVAPLLMDQQLPVREAAASLLRDLSTLDDPVVGDKVACVDVMSSLSGMLSDAVSHLYGIDGQCDAVGFHPVRGTIASEGTADQIGEEGVAISGVGGGMSRAGEEGGAVGGAEEQGRDIGKSEAEGGGGGACGGVKGEVKGQVHDILCQGLHLVKIISERNSQLLDIFNHQNLLPVILQLIQCFDGCLEFPLLAAQVLMTILEDNADCAESILTSPDTLSLLTSALHLQVEDERGLLWPFKASIAGALYHIMLHIKNESERLRLLELVLLTHVTVLDAVTDSIGTVTTSQQFDVLMNVLKAKELTMEILTNMAYVEEECDAEVVMEGEEEEEGSGSDTESMEVEQVPPLAAAAKEVPLPPRLTSLVTLSLHHKVWENVSCTGALLSQGLQVDGCPGNHKQMKESFEECVYSTLVHSLHALQNLISVLPVDAWGDTTSLSGMWSNLFDLLGRLPSPEGVSGVMVALLHRAGPRTLCVTVEHVEVASEYLRRAESHSVQGDMVVLLGEAAKLQLSSTQLDKEVLTVIGVGLRECISHDPSLQVVSQALDAVFDVFGADNCPVELFASLSFLPVLEQCRATFKARFQMERRSLNEHLGLVQNTRANLPRFIDYMKSHARTD